MKIITYTDRCFYLKSKIYYEIKGKLKYREKMLLHNSHRDPAFAYILFLFYIHAAKKYIFRRVRGSETEGERIREREAKMS